MGARIRSDRHRRGRAPGWVAFAILAWGLTAARRSGAVLDLDDKGPVLDAGRVRMRVTNAGILGNAFFAKGRSFDPSFEFPAYTGNEGLNYAALWVGGTDSSGAHRVSGGPILEWRPTLAADDRVRGVRRGQFGVERLVDDDGDGRTDEETLNGHDDDGDHFVDEDLALAADQLLSSDYSDDETAAVDYVYAEGEKHSPLHLAVHQEALAWRTPGSDGTVGITFSITNRGRETLHDLYLGVYADLDSRGPRDPSGHLNDRVERREASVTINDGLSTITVAQHPVYTTCIRTLDRQIVVLTDDAEGSGFPAVALLPLEHTVDPLAFTPASASAQAPGTIAFRSSVFLLGRSYANGGAPQLDAERYEALQGTGRPPPEDAPGDYAVLVSCGPFPRLDPGRTIKFSVAMVAASSADSVVAACSNALLLHHGVALNLLPDTTDSEGNQWRSGSTGIFGHEVCLEAPAGNPFVMDPHCASKFGLDDAIPVPVLYEPGRCIWTDADCDVCTGLNGAETVVRWLDPLAPPPGPAMRVIEGDHEVTIEWDNFPEVVLGAAQRTPACDFAGYRVYRLADWRRRQSPLPPLDQWALLGQFGPDSSFSARGLETVIDSTIEYDRILLEQRHYPPGRYRISDPDVHNGFPYVYAVTTVCDLHLPTPPGVPRARLESPLLASIQPVSVPRAASRGDLSRVRVVPNPFRATADWDLPAIPSDPLPRHVAFMGLPAAPAHIRIYTVAGDLVDELDHDGSGGDGQVSWNLISRNGQDVASGIYLFTVESPLGRTIGRFVIIR